MTKQAEQLSTIRRKLAETDDRGRALVLEIDRTGINGVPRYSPQQTLGLAV